VGLVDPIRSRKIAPRRNWEIFFSKWYESELLEKYECRERDEVGVL
jgi:hypothetical protein